MKNPVISIIAPIYGVEKYIAAAAESLLSQSYPHIQFIFVNDGTKDNSIAILESLIEEKFSQLKDKIIIVNKENAGLPAARRTGIEHATGDYIYHVDSDDYISEGSIAAIAKAIEESDADVIYFNYVKEYDNRVSIKREKLYTIEQKNEYIRNMFNHKSYGTLCNKCVKRSIYQDNTIHTPKFGYAEDCYVSSQIIGYASSIKYIDEVVYHYRKNVSTAMTRQGRKKRKMEYALNFLDLYEKYRDVPQDKNPVAVLFDDILLQAGWFSILYKLDLFSKFPYLAGDVKKAKIKCGGKSDAPVIAQIITKIVACFK